MAASRGHGGHLPPVRGSAPHLPPVRRKKGQNKPFLANIWICAPSESHFAPSMPPHKKKILVPPLIIKQVLRTAPNRSAPGYDRIPYIDFKISNVINLLKSIFNTCLKKCKIPSDWKHAIINLIPKSSVDSRDLSEWRPISKLVTIYKMFMMVLGKRIIPWIVETNRLSHNQKGSLPRKGFQEHVFCLKTLLLIPGINLANCNCILCFWTWLMLLEVLIMK